MKTPVTYIGFFQSEGETAKGNDQWHFFPVYSEWPTSPGEPPVFIEEFPNDNFNFGKLQLRQELSIGDPRYIPLAEIENAYPNKLTKVTFDQELFFSVPDKKNQLRFARIEAPLNGDINEAIRVEELLPGDLPGYPLINVTDLTPDLRYKKNCLLDLENYSDRPESRFSNGQINENFYTIQSENGSLVSAGVKPKLMGAYENAAVFNPNAELSVCDYTEENVETIKVPFYADGWIKENEFENKFKFEHVEYFSLIRIKESATTRKGKLSLDLKAKKCTLQLIDNPPKGDGDDDGGGKDGNDGGGGDPPPKKEPVSIVDRVHQYLKDSGRVVSKADVINYCICITQGFITTFAGAPGTGKTSLCRLLAKALGLKEAEEITDGSDPRYTEVSVERGWTSLKDFIGYPDPFKTEKESSQTVKVNGKKAKENPPTEDDDHIVPSNIDVYNAFKRMNEESRKNPEEFATKPLDLMLLDEANLSPIEYYWSQFLRNCQLDDEAELKKRKIQVSRYQSWLLSPNLRFLATVNFDHTTEELSPRFLDRTWVVTLEPPKEIGEKKNPVLQEEAVKMSDLQDKFGFPQEGETFPAETEKVWADIQDAFKADDVGLPLSPRNVNAVKNYCIAAARFKDKGEDGITPLAALDLAVLQKILPAISGYGTRYVNLTKRLLEIATENKLERTKNKLNSMIDAAKDNSNFYQFFIR